MNKLDILNREKFVEQLINLTENISSNRSSVTFAINGKWGCGKSFVLDMFEERLSQYQSEETATDKYLIIRYNCWKYDYYEEPLIAIVAAIIAEIEEKTKIIPDSKEKQEILGMLKATGISLLSMLNTAVKNKTGIDIKEAFDTVNKGSKEGAAKYDKEHSFDVYFSFKKVMDTLQQTINKLSSKYSVVFLVDELDRCLPEYAIKVLERLHHLSDGTTNVITIISTDKEQLSLSIKKTFGFDNPEKYLEKFLNFELPLDLGTISSEILDKYPNYTKLFSNDLFPVNESVHEFIQVLFEDIGIRTQEQLFRRATIAHTLLYNDIKDYTFMCVELLISVSLCYYNYMPFLEGKCVSSESVVKMFGDLVKVSPPKYAEYLAKKINLNSLSRTRSHPVHDYDYILQPDRNLHLAIIYTWYLLHADHNKFGFECRANSPYTLMKDNATDLKRFAETIRMIK